MDVGGLIHEAAQETFERFSNTYKDENNLKRILDYMERRIDEKVHAEISEIAKDLREENKKHGETKFFHNLKGRIIALHKLVG